MKNNELHYEYDISTSPLNKSKDLAHNRTLKK